METRKVDKDFKIQAVKLIVERGRKAVDVARELGINIKTLHAWKYGFLKKGPNAFISNALAVEESEDLKRMRKELADVTMERDILKKALGVYSRLHK